MIIRNISNNGFSRKVVLNQENDFFFEHDSVQKTNACPRIK